MTRMALTPREVAKVVEGIDEGDGAIFSGADVHVLQVEYDLFDDHHRIRGAIKNLPALKGYLNSRPKRLRERMEVSRKAQLEEHKNFVFEAIRESIHATAVASIIKDRDFGIAPEVFLCFDPIRAKSSEIDPYSLQTAFFNMTQQAQRYGLRPGDIVTASLQLNNYRSAQNVGLLLPIDFNDEIRSSINILVEKLGLIVFIAAGNLSVDLDNCDIKIPGLGEPDSYKKYSDVGRESKAIVVGYSCVNHESVLKSNYGEVVDLYAPAESIIAACYYSANSTMKGGLLDADSDGFCKTSASTPIVAAIAARLQSGYKRLTGKVLSSDELLKILKESGEKGVIDGRCIGIFPNFQMAIDIIKRDYI